MNTDIARRLMREAQTLDRLAAAQCNGDWPADNGERPVIFCTCGSGFVPSVFKGKPRLCPDCRATARVQKMLPEGFKAIFGGDPRGCVLKITVPSGATNDWGKDGICVPVRVRY